MRVEELFEEYANKPVDFLSNNNGNRGDGLIYKGCKTLLDKYNIQYNEFYLPQEEVGKTLFIQGGGAYYYPCLWGLKSVLNYIDKFEEIFILPSSFGFNYRKIKDFIANLPKKVTVFCREKYSYEAVLKNATYKEKIFLDHDMAFRMDFSKWKKEGNGKLIAFREDSRSGMRQKPKENIDVSKGRVTEWEILLKLVSQYAEVHTDRAHVSISAAMLGKKTYVYPMRYHKLKGIYEYSLSHLEHVEWVEAEVRKSPPQWEISLVEMSKKFLGRKMYLKLRSHI